MAIEKKWGTVTPKSFTADGTQFGVVTIADTTGFKVKGVGWIQANTLPNIVVQIQRVLSSTQMIVGPPTTTPAPNNFTDISAYTVALMAKIGFAEQDKNKIKPDDIEQAVYEADPTVANRAVLVDQYGDFYSMDNPIPAVFEGSISIGAVTVTNFPTTVDTNYGPVGPNTIRSASQIGNATGSAAFGSGITTGQVLRVVLPTDQTAIPVSQSGMWTVSLASGSIEIGTVDQGTPNTIGNAWPVKPTDGTNSQSFTGAGEAKVSVTEPLPAGTNTIGAVNQGTSPWVVSGTVTANQGTSPWVVSGTVTTSPDVNIHDSAGSALTSTGGSLNANITNTVAVSQSTIPWVVSGTVAATQSGIWNTGRTWTLASGTDSATVVQGTSPWVVSGTVTTSPDVNVHDGAGVAISSTGSSLNVDVTNIVPVSQSGTWTVQQGTPPWSVSQSGTWNVGVTNLPTTVDTNYGLVGASTIRTAAQIGNATGSAAFGAGTTTAQVLRVVLPTDQTAIPVSQSGVWTTGRTWTLASGTDSATVVQGTSPWVDNISQFGGSAVVTGTGASGAGIPRVTVSNDSNILATQSGTWNITNITGTVSLPTGASTSANQTNGTQKTQIVDGAGNVVGPEQTVSGTNYFPVVLAASATPGAALVARSIQVAGSDGTNAQTFKTDTSGHLLTALVSPPVGTITQAGRTIGTTALRATVSGSAPSATRTLLAITADSASTAKFYIGSSTVTNTGANAGIQFTATQPVIFSNDAADYWIISDTAGQTVYFMEQA